MKFVGQSVRRREDSRLLTGRGRYVADLVLPHMLTAVVVRSLHAHARIRRIATNRARAVPGFVDCVTFADVRDRAIPIPVRMGARPALIPYLQRPLADDRVRYVGEPVAVIVATDPFVAEDARELVEVDYEPLPAVVDVERALAPEGPAIFPEGNLAASWTVDLGDVEGSSPRTDPRAPAGVRHPPPHGGSARNPGPARRVRRRARSPHDVGADQGAVLQSAGSRPHARP